MGRARRADLRQQAREPVHDIERELGVVVFAIAHSEGASLIIKLRGDDRCFREHHKTPGSVQHGNALIAADRWTRCELRRRWDEIDCAIAQDQ